MQQYMAEVICECNK